MLGIVACLTNLLLVVLVSENVSMYVPKSMSEHLGSFEGKVSKRLLFGTPLPIAVVLLQACRIAMLLTYSNDKIYMCDSAVTYSIQLCRVFGFGTVPCKGVVFRQVCTAQRVGAESTRVRVCRQVNQLNQL